MPCIRHHQKQRFKIELLVTIIFFRGSWRLNPLSRTLKATIFQTQSDYGDQASFSDSNSSISTKANIESLTSQNMTERWWNEVISRYGLMTSINFATCGLSQRSTWCIGELFRSSDQRIVGFESHV